MLWSKQSPLRRPWIILPALFLCFSIPFLLFRSAPFEKLNGWLTSTTQPEPAAPEPVPEIPGFYDWHTRSSFNPVRQENAANKSLKELCASFPTHLLDEIQPVLKTGHGVLDVRVRPQLQSVSACLSNLLIFSDVDEHYEGRDIIDVIADIPPALSENAKQLDEWRDGSLVDGPSSKKSAGWKIDKFKFLPAASRAWRMRPRRRWYVFYEADTYIVWDNVFRLLENFDPDKPHYFGSPSPGKDDTWFANGGPGYILSREAVRRLLQDDWDPETGEYLGMKLIERYWDFLTHDCCGDSVLGFALWEHNVSLSGLWPMFNPHPPQGVPFADLYWCQPLLTMHKPLEEHILGLWRWQLENRVMRRPLLYRDLATSYFELGTFATREDWFNAGWDSFPAPNPSKFYTHDPHESFDACGRACKAQENCFQYQYHLRKCTFVKIIKFGVAAEPRIDPKGKKEESEEELAEWEKEDLRFMAGWDTEKILKWMEERPCEQVKWVRPSVKRIF